MKAKSAPRKPGCGRAKGKKASTRSAVLSLVRVLRGLTTAQMANTAKLNEIHAVVKGLRGHDYFDRYYFDRSDLDRAMRDVNNAMRDVNKR